MNEHVTFNQKTRLLSKLFEAGCTNETKLKQLDMKHALKIPGITTAEMGIIIELQDRTRANRLFSYLGGERDERQEKE